MLLSKTRDAAWMLMVSGAIVTYIETVYPVLEISGIRAGNTLFIGSVPLMTILLPALSTVFFIVAFLVMVIRQRRVS
jgi:phosphotransacetylase